MPECAFCPHDGKLSAEHITSEWMSQLFPGKLSVWYTKGRGKKTRWQSDTMDWKARVVCETCNNTWMSDIEAKHAKPVLTPLITGGLDIPIRLAEARSMALFAFKTAVVLDHANRRPESHFFERSLRHSFRENLSIPANVQMWLGGFVGHRGNGHFTTLYHQGQLSATDSFLMYVCTFALGNLAIQVVAVKDKANDAIIRSDPRFKVLAVPFWPGLRPDFVWPARDALRSNSDFDAFANRWETIEVIPL